MITAQDVQRLLGLTKEQVVAHEVSPEAALLHSGWFTLEVPTKLAAAGALPLGPALEGAETWRTYVPPTEGYYAQGIRTTNPDDKEQLIKLISDVGAAYIQPSIFEFVTKHLPEPEFRVHEGDHAPVSIWSAGVLVGAVAQVTL